ncbi:Hypothetical protein CINCED_3A001652 [Cinara cedri]|uniref:Uncharacterized protein n=1 Tax=Cinara cedri TaxID=506608 RepID=A0A5E4NRN0_9HEMI|nr:Hypothetical protein CINCED_3A001652 [Cinara cedri]
MDSKVIELLEAIKSVLNLIVLRQQYDGEIIQKSGNSINIIIQLLAGILRLKTPDLTAILKKGDGVMHCLRPFEDSNYESLDLNSNKYPINHLRSMLLDLVKTIDSMNKVTQSGQGSGSLSLLNIPSTSSQADTSHILTNAIKNNIIPNVQLNVDVPKTTISEKKITPVITKNYNNKYKEDEEANVLRRRYRNKYRYLPHKYGTLNSRPIEKNVQNVREIPVVKHVAETSVNHVTKKIEDSEMVLVLSKYDPFFKNILKGPLNFIDADTLRQRYRGKEETKKPSENKHLNREKRYVELLKTVEFEIF